MADKANEKQAKEKKPAEKKAGGKGKKGAKKKGGAASAVQIAASGETTITGIQKPNMLKLYEETVVPDLKKQFQIKNAMDIPRIKKVVINCGVKEAVGNPKVLDNTLNDIALISGQKPILTRAKKAIANFKVRKGIPLGVRVTLRRARMYEFLDRLVNVALPRVRDFKGVNPKAFDGRGNYSLGIKEQIIFPEIDYDKVDSVRGFSITVETTAKNNEQARALLTGLGMPFRK